MNNQLLWYATRGAGAVTLILLSGVVVLGLAARTRFERRGWPRFLSAALHRDLALMALVFLGLHIVTAVVDPFTHLGIVAATVPFGSYYRTIWLGLGTVSFELILAIIVTSLFRRVIGHCVWRSIHWLAYAAWPVAVLHGLGTGTDAFSWWMLGITAACVVVVVAAVVWRIGAAPGDPLEGTSRRGTAGSIRSHAMSGLNLLPNGVSASAAEGLVSHTTRLGPLPPSSSDFISALERSGLRGRGGAGFPVGTKWLTVASRPGRAPVVLVNGAEGEPLSRKDRRLMETRPHLILDGAAIAARTVGAARIVYYIGAEHRSALAAIKRGLSERPADEQRHSLVVTAPPQYVAGEESAAVHFVNDGVALPTATPPRPFERGVGGRPTLVQNVETLAHVAMIARHGDGWFRALGEGSSVGTALITVSGAVPAPSVIEVAQGTTIGDAVSAAGGLVTDASAVLLGGYFGRWVAADEAWRVRLEERSIGCGVVGVLAADSCGVTTTARVMSYLARESSRQCGPCAFGLSAIAASTTRVAALSAHSDDLEHIERWAGLLPGRGACRHPDGAAGFLVSALHVFADEFALHAQQRRCRLGDALRVAA